MRFFKMLGKIVLVLVVLLLAVGLLYVWMYLVEHDYIVPPGSRNVNRTNFDRDRIEEFDAWNYSEHTKRICTCRMVEVVQACTMLKLSLIHISW